MAEVVAGDYLNIQHTEDLLSGGYTKSIRDRELVLDLSAVKWLAPLSVTTMFLWAMQVRDKHGEATGEATIVFPPAETYAGSYLAITNAAAAFSSQGIVIQGDHAALERESSPLAAFEVFESVESFERYRNHLDDPLQQSILLHSSTIPEIVTSGHAHKVLLKELVDNTFFHAGGRHSHYALVTTSQASSGRLAHPSVASLGGAAYIDLCVGDSARRNLVSSLSNDLPADYVPEIVQDEEAKALDNIEKTILYAFEYASTSNQERRRESLRKWLDDPELDDRAVATGLHDVASLVKAYQGQLILRVEGRLGTLDYSRGRPVPTVRFWRRQGKRSLVRLQGTIIDVRLPLGPYAGPMAITRSISPHNSSGRRQRSPQLSVVAESTTTLAMSDGDRLIGLERDVVHQLQQRAVEPRVVSVVFDNLMEDAKLLSAFFELLTRIPRHNNGLVLLASDPRQLTIATDAWSGFGKRLGRTALSPDNSRRGRFR